MRVLIRFLFLSIIQSPFIYFYAVTNDIFYFVMLCVMVTAYISLLSLEVTNNSIFADEMQKHFLELLQAISKTQAKLKSMKHKGDEEVDGDIDD